MPNQSKPKTIEECKEVLKNSRETMEYVGKDGFRRSIAELIECAKRVGAEEEKEKIFKLHGDVVNYLIEVTGSERTFSLVPINEMFAELELNNDKTD